MADPSGGYLTYALYTLLVGGIALGFIFALKRLNIKQLLITTFILTPTLFILMAVLSTRP